MARPLIYDLIVNNVPSVNTHCKVESQVENINANSNKEILIRTLMTLLTSKVML
jgi:hypothetical protein